MHNTLPKLGEWEYLASAWLRLTPGLESTRTLVSDEGYVHLKKELPFA